MNNRYIRFISMVLCIIIFMTPLVACSSADKEVKDSLTSDQVTEITEMLETLVSEETSQSNNVDSYTPVTTSTAESIVESALDVLESENNDDFNEELPSSFVGNLDVFVYGLLINQVLLNYDCFNATIRLDDGSYMSGIAYTDYGSYYEVVDETSEYTEGYFPAGFIPLMDEPVRFCDMKKDLHGVEIRNSDYEIDNNSFFLAYDLRSFTDHCVVWGQYLKYGIDDNGDVFYETREFDGTNFDKTVGSLYSFDSGTEIYQGPYNGITKIKSESISSQIDFIEMNKQINDLLDQQDANFSSAEVNTYFCFAQERVNAFLLAQQEETFMGFKVDELVKYMENLSPSDCIRITPNGIEINALMEEVPEEPSLFVKWLVGINAAVAVIGAIVVPLFIPALKPVCEAVAGASTEIFFEVVIQNRTLKNVNWGKVAVAAVTSVAFGFITSIKSFAIGFASSAVVGGASAAAFAYFDGKSTDEIINAFVFGAVIAATVYTVARITSVAVTNVVNKSKFLTNMSSKANNFINKHQVMLFVDSNGNPTWLEKALNPRARAMAEFAMNQFDDKYLDLGRVKNVKYYDSKGVEITKAKAFELEDSYMILDAKKNPEVVEKIGEKISLKFGKPDIDNMGVYKFSMKITPERKDINFPAAISKVRNDYQNNSLPKEFADELNEYLMTNNKTISSFSVEDLNDMGYTFHEGINSITIIDSEVHSFFGHAGGVYYAQQLETFIYDYTALDFLAGVMPECIVGTFVVA